PWDMMSRGTFNGPGGPFERWTIPPREGGTMGSHHMIRNKLRLGFIPPSEVRTITRSALDAAGIVRTRILQRESPPLTADAPPSPADPQNHIYSGMRIVLGEDQRTCDYSKPKCDGGNYDNYDIEVVNRQGFDSFIPDHGVLIAKTKNGDVPAPFIWVIDSHPKNLKKVDYVRADGEKFRYTVGDYRQLSDAAFHAGTGPGVRNRHKDKANGLAFYILKKGRLGKGKNRRLTYTVAVQSLTAPDVPSPAEVSKGKGGLRRGEVKRVIFNVTNTGVQNAVYQLSVERKGKVKTRLLNDLRFIRAGDTVKVRVWGKKLGRTASIELKAREL
ncbi:MAG: peptidase M6, partial [Actinomycetota bacterium]|nr:peptidase M6 [Actinomycetota bacterium]